MTLNSSFTNLMDTARTVSGVSNKLSISELSNLVSRFGLVDNDNLVYDYYRYGLNVTSHKTDKYPQWVSFTVTDTLKPNTIYTISASATTTSSNSKVQYASFRIFNGDDNRELPGTSYTSGSNRAGLFVLPADGKKHQYTFTTDGYTRYRISAYAGWAGATPTNGSPYGFDFTTTYQMMKVEEGNLATEMTENTKLLNYPRMFDILKDDDASDLSSYMSINLKAELSSDKSYVTLFSNPPSNVQDADNRIVSIVPGLASGKYIDDSMIVIATMRLSANFNGPSMHVYMGGYGAYNMVMVDMKDWRAYIVPMRSSDVSNSLSISIPVGYGKGQFVDIKSLKLIRPYLSGGGNNS